MMNASCRRLLLRPRVLVDLARGSGLSVTYCPGTPHPPWLLLATSNLSSSSSIHTTTTNPPSHEIVLYKRGPGRNTLLLSGLGFSTFHTVYWVWYINDFIPAVNASDCEAFHIDPTLGIAGLVLAVAIQTVFCLHPRRLISKLSLSLRTTVGDSNKKKNQLLVYRYRLPLLRPTWRPKVYDVGEVRMDLMSPEAEQVVKELRGDFSKFKGNIHLSTNKQWLPYLLEIQEPSEVLQPDLLLDAILFPNKLLNDDYDQERHFWNKTPQRGRLAGRAKPRKKLERRR